MESNDRIEITVFSNYKDYLDNFFPNLEKEADRQLSAEEIGIKMAKDTIKSIKQMLIENTPSA